MSELREAMAEDPELRQCLAAAVGLGDEVATLDAEDSKIIEEAVLARMDENWDGKISGGEFNK